MVFNSDRKIQLDRTSPIPLYYQIYRILSDSMKKRDSIGKKLPTEERLMKAFAVSRDTVRRALQALENSGKISRTRGKGTVITSSTSQEQLTSIRSFTEQMRIENHVPITKVVEVKKIKADSELSKRLKIPKGDELLRVSRLRGNETYFPLALFISYLTYRSNLSGDENFEGSLYELMKEKGTAVVEGDAVIEGRLAKGKVARLLELEDGAPILYYERLGCNENGESVEFVQCWYEATHYQFRIHLTTRLERSNQHEKEGNTK